MQKLSQAKEFSAKADNYITEGNYEYAVRCYDHIVQILVEAVREAQSKETINSLKAKIKKYQAMKEASVAEIHKKQTKVVQVSKFGFPAQKPDPVEYFIKQGTSKLKKNDYINKHMRTEECRTEDQTPKEPSRKEMRQHNRKVEAHEPRRIFKHENKLANLDPDIANLIIKNLDVSFDDIVGLKEVKDILQEAVIRPRQRPDLYSGIRAPPKGILLYGPPGNGKTYICKALANQCNCTFFVLSAASVMNKLVGESERTIKKIFEAAEYMAPSIIFIDEIDSMLTARTEKENEASRRLKTQFLVQMEGMQSAKRGDVLVIGATNLPKQLDSAARRRFSKAVYVDHPDPQARREMVLRNLKGVEFHLPESDMKKLVRMLEYYSASEIRNIVAEVSMMPLRELQRSEFKRIKSDDLRKIVLGDFEQATKKTKPILTREELEKYKNAI